LIGTVAGFTSEIRNKAAQLSNFTHLLAPPTQVQVRRIIKPKMERSFRSSHRYRERKMADDYLKYGDRLRIINAYGGVGLGGYLGVGGESKVPSAVDNVGTYASLSGQELATQWTIMAAPGSSKTPGQNVCSGDQIRLQNYQDESYLALFSSNPPGDSGYPVATTTTLNDDTIAAAWYVLISSQNKRNDPNLSDTNDIYLVATFGTLAGALDTNGVGAGGFKYSVTGARLLNRDGGSGSWQVVKIRN
jgi:hypothetical protein